MTSFLIFTRSLTELMNFLKMSEVKDIIILGGKVTGYTGKKIRNFISIGIGGSYLGVEFIYQSLRNHPDLQKKAFGYNIHFLANVCPIDFERSIENFDPEETLIIIISKTFTTAETMLNARTCRHWITNAYKNIVTL